MGGGGSAAAAVRAGTGEARRGGGAVADRRVADAGPRTSRVRDVQRVSGAGARVYAKGGRGPAEGREGAERVAEAEGGHGRWSAAVHGGARARTRDPEGHREGMGRGDGRQDRARGRGARLRPQTRRSAHRPTG